MTESVAPKRTKKKISRRKKARAKKTLQTALNLVLEEISNDSFLKSHLFLDKPEKDKLVVGAYIVVKTKSGLYNVYKKTLNDLVYEDLYTFDAAMALVEALNAGATRGLNDITIADEEFGLNYNEMQMFERGYRNAIKNKTGNEYVYEDRYLVVYDKAQKALSNLKRFRIAK